MKVNKWRRFFRRCITLIQNFQHQFREQLNPEPLLILGNQKSGTTAIAGLLAEATGSTVALDLPGLNEPIISQIHEKSIPFDTIVKRHLYRDFCKDIVKEPMLTFLYESELKKYYPNSKYILIIRHPLQNIRSQLNWIKIAGTEEILDKKNDKLTPERLRVFNNAGLSFHEEHLIKNLALRWNHCVQVYLNHPEKIHLVKYEDFVNDKKNYVESLAQHLGMEIKSDISAKVNFQYQPAGKADIDLKEFFGMKNYMIILETCQEFMPQVGYPIEL